MKSRAAERPFWSQKCWKACGGSLNVHQSSDLCWSCVFAVLLLTSSWVCWFSDCDLKEGKWCGRWLGLGRRPPCFQFHVVEEVFEAPLGSSVRETQQITSGKIMQQQFLSVISCLNSRGISAVTAYNLPHVSLNEHHNKGYPIQAKCHNLKQSGCITWVSLPCC